MKKIKKAVDKYIECGDKKEALAFGEYQMRSMYLFDRPGSETYIESKNLKLQHQMKYWNIVLKIMRAGGRTCAYKEGEDKAVITVLDPAGFFSYKDKSC